MTSRVAKLQAQFVDVLLTKQDCEVVNCTRSCVKTKSKLTNLMKISRIEGYNSKYGSNPQGIDRRNLDFKHSLDAKKSLEVIGIKRLKRFCV